eukprot:TRINITY_DN7272_c0_g1_i1.p1 TRINITY_DN7272_c0_g1~~TRINITY_DN7272_c0_g1_i1.p1  ORF type:complete len:879 (-),score=195.76 TRINITY_DN7272_c0_g1_i1:42-2678(-)
MTHPLLRAFHVEKEADADDAAHLTPICSVWCNWCSVACVVMFVYVHFTCEYHETRPAVGEEDPWMRWFMQTTGTLALGGLIYEGTFFVGLRLCGLKTSLYDTEPLLRKRLRMNVKMIYVYTMLSTIYHLMAFDFQVVHKGWLADYYGGHQIVYSFRYIEWCCCAPMVLSVNGQLTNSPNGRPRNGLLPSAILTGVYCATAWQGLVVADYWAAWALITISFVAYFLASWEQLVFAWHIKNDGAGGVLRCAVLVYLVIMIGIYGVVYLLPIPGWCSATFENKFYCVGDASFKLGTTMMAVVASDIDPLFRIKSRAVAIAEDRQRLIDSASVPIFSIDLAGRISQWNAKIAEITNLSEEFARGYPLRSMLGNTIQESGEDMLSLALKGEKTAAVETTLTPPSLGVSDSVKPTRMVTMVLSAAPRVDNDGLIVGATLIGYDLTQVAAYREAEERKVRFMAVVSHELRSPLHGITGLTDILLEGEEDAMKNKYLTMVKGCANRLLDLVINIMELASMTLKKKSQLGGNDFARDPVQLKLIIDEVVMLVNKSKNKANKPLVKKGVQLLNEIGDLPIIEADAHKCTQVFFNLITNACKFTDEGTVKITSRADPDGAWVEVLVTDTGMGITPQSLERIFKPFEQEDSSMTRSFQGVGLGLSIAYEVVKRHGGHIKVESEVGVGSTFIVRLPISMPDADDEAVEEKEPAASIPEEAPASKDQKEKETTEPEKEKPKNSKNPKTPAPREEAEQPHVGTTAKPLVLSVDDDQLNQDVANRHLEADYEVHSVMSGDEAVKYLETCDKLPDVMLLDMMMPGLSGIDVAKIVRDEMKISDETLPILMLSATQGENIVADALVSGVTSFITKPSSKVSLLAHVHAAMRLKKVA